MFILKKNMIVLSIIGFIFFKSIYLFAFFGKSGIMPQLTMFLMFSVLPCAFILWKYTDEEILEKLNDSDIKSNFSYCCSIIMVGSLGMHLSNNYQLLMFDSNNIFLTVLFRIFDFLSTLIVCRMTFNTIHLFISGKVKGLRV